ncbi:hypothetical protein KC326_g4 [Hortaea werneckii]|nr:hypothetical protein KC326_g4 [Hortaea werneckii]
MNGQVQASSIFAHLLFILCTAVGGGCVFNANGTGVTWAFCGLVMGLGAAALELIVSRCLTLGRLPAKTRSIVTWFFNEVDWESAIRPVDREMPSGVARMATSACCASTENDCRWKLSGGDDDAGPISLAVASTPSVTSALARWRAAVTSSARWGARAVWRAPASASRRASVHRNPYRVCMCRHHGVPFLVAVTSSLYAVDGLGGPAHLYLLCDWDNHARVREYGPCCAHARVRRPVAFGLLHAAAPPRSRVWSARVYYLSQRLRPTLSFISSVFLASSSSLGTPVSLSWALSSRFHRCWQNPVGSAQCCISRRKSRQLTYLLSRMKPETRSDRISSTSPSMRLSSPAAHVVMTSLLTLVVSTFLLNSGGNLVVRSSRLSTSVVKAADIEGATCIDASYSLGKAAARVVMMFQTDESGKLGWMM